MHPMAPTAKPHSQQRSNRDGEVFMNDAASTVFIVDSSCEFRSVLSHLLTATHHQVRLFESAEQFLAAQNTETPGCILLDIFLSGMNGLALQRALYGLACAHPMVFLTESGDVQSSVDAMKGGAIDFLARPIDDKRLLAAIEQALQRDAQQRQERQIGSRTQQCFSKLTPRERQVMAQVVRGRLNKEIAAEIGVGEKTVKVHRARVMSKMRARSVPELVQLGTRVGVAIKPALSVGTQTLIWN
jgi:RNA polymerase sigma factor (sigma-70 family)